MDKKEEQDLRSLLEALQKLDKWMEIMAGDEFSAFWRVAPGSPLAGDNRHSPAYRVSHRAQSALTIAFDFLHCLRRSLVGELRENQLPVRLHSYAQLALIRGAIENAACAVWLLGPRRRLERITNRLSLEWKELNPAYRLRELARSAPPRTKEARQAQLVSILLTAGFRCEVPEGMTEKSALDRGARKALKGLDYVDIVRQAGELSGLGSAMVEASWSACSGVAHGDSNASLGLLHREVVGTVEPGVSLMRLSAPVEMMYLTALGAIALIDKGLALYADRARALSELLASPGA